MALHDSFVFGRSFILTRYQFDPSEGWLEYQVISQPDRYLCSLVAILEYGDSLFMPNLCQALVNVRFVLGLLPKYELFYCNRLYMPNLCQALVNVILLL